jgi:hypothetical protein
MLDSIVSNIHNSKEGGKIISTIQPLNKKKKALTKLALKSKICYLQHYVQRQNNILQMQILNLF